jgi:hypothetical protein
MIIHACGHLTGDDWKDVVGQRVPPVEHLCRMVPKHHTVSEYQDFFLLTNKDSNILLYSPLFFS